MKTGIIIASFGLIILILFLSTGDHSMFEMYSIIIFCFLVMFFGVLMETSLFNFLKEVHDEKSPYYSSIENSSKKGWS